MAWYYRKGNNFFEVVGDRLYPMNADIYHKKTGRYYVGYRNEKGKYAVHEIDATFKIISDAKCWKCCRRL